VTNARGESLRGTPIVDEAAERCRITFTSSIAPGTWRLRLTFTGILNDKLRGFYRSSYKDPSGEPRLMAATQFEATDARRAFPCWDEPAFKAVFAVTLVIDPKLTAVSNTSIVSERAERGRKVVTFADTMKMSTYLVAFVVGELEATERCWSAGRRAGLVRTGQAAPRRLRPRDRRWPRCGSSRTTTACRTRATSSTCWRSRTFAAGAMENLGAITFRETALLVDARAASHSELERVADVVAHENRPHVVRRPRDDDLVERHLAQRGVRDVHGDLAVDAWKPEWQRWTTFGVSRAAALSVDGLHSTRPIEFHVEAPRDADAMFDVLTYEKGASVLRMLEQYLGTSVFRDGVREYLRRHAYDNAETGDLWAALGRAANQPIPEVMDAWIFKPGYPLVSARLEGGQLVLSQQRFNYLPEPLPGSTPAPKNQLWQVPVQVRLSAAGRASSERRLLAGADLRVPVPERLDAVLVNEGGHGFYRVRYSGELLERLLGKLDTLAGIERFNLVNDAWAVTVAGHMTLTDYLDLTARFRGERDRNVWSVLLASFAMLNRVVAPADRPRLAALVRDRVAPAFADLGWTPKSSEDELTRQLRGDLVRALGVLGDDRAIQARAAELYARSTADLDPNVLPRSSGCSPTRERPHGTTNS
jgi:puromycin-sensitive aminopeptidase